MEFTHVILFLNIYAKKRFLTLHKITLLQSLIKTMREREKESFFIFYLLDNDLSYY